MSNRLKLKKGKKKKRFSARPGANAKGRADTLFHSALEHHQSGRLDEAEKLYREVIKIVPGFIDAWNNLGAALMAKGKLADAEKVYRIVLGKQPDFSPGHYNLGLSLLKQGKTDPAMKSFSKTVQLDPSHFDAFCCLGQIALERDNFESAVSYYQQAVDCNASSPNALFSLGLALKKSGDLPGAEKCYLRVIEISPEYKDVHNNLAIVYGLFGDFDKAEIYYRKALEQEPGCIRTRSNFAEMLEKANRLDEVGEIVDSILDDDGQCIPAKRLKATLLRRQGEADKGIDLLGDVSVPKGHVELAVEVHSELGKLYDRAGNPEKAFHHFREAKHLQKNNLAGTGVEPENFIGLVEKISQQIPPEAQKAVTGGASKLKQGTPPIFLVGFPRSGTTLLDQILDSHPGFCVAEETPVLDEVINKISAYSLQYPESLQDISLESIIELSGEYHSRMTELYPDNKGAVIDKYPFHLIHLGLINKLFPEAKIIFAIRHPYDVCLSCFMQLFSLNDSMANFFTLESAAGCYARVMDLWLKYEKVLPLDIHKIRYEDLVSDFDSEVKSLLTFLGAEWDESVLSFHEHAKKRGPILTPSYQQVTEKVYTRAAGRWQRYEKFFKPVKQQLDPYVEYFGYQT